MSSSTPTVYEVRLWAKENNIEVGERGRLSAQVVAAYNQANAQRKFITE